MHLEACVNADGKSEKRDVENCPSDRDCAHSKEGKMEFPKQGRTCQMRARRKERVRIERDGKRAE